MSNEVHTTIEDRIVTLRTQARRAVDFYPDGACTLFVPAGDLLAIFAHYETLIAALTDAAGCDVPSGPEATSEQILAAVAHDA